MKPDEKICPFCGETIKAVAIRCKHCHAELTGTPPVSVSLSLRVAAVAAAPGIPTASVPPLPAALETGQVLDLLSHLVDKNLVVYEETEDGQGRYRLLETVRQYARDRLTESGESLVVRARHGDYFLTLAEEAMPKLTGPEQGQWLGVLEEEHDNLRQASTLYVEDIEDTEAGEKGLRLGAALSHFWWTRWHLSEGRERLGALLANPEGQERTKARADALLGAGSLAWMQGDYGGAHTLLDESLAIARELGDKSGIASSLNLLGNVAYKQGDYAQARVLLEESLIIARELGDKLGIARSLHFLGHVAKDEGDYDGARVLLEESLTIWRASGYQFGIASSLYFQGSVAYEQGDYGRARVLLEESLTMGRALGAKAVIADDLKAFATLAAREVQEERGARLWAAAAALRETLGAPLSPAEQEKQEREMAAVRETMGEDAFAVAWAQGQAMTMEQAIEYALEGETDA